MPDDINVFELPNPQEQKPIEERRPLHQSDIKPKMIKQRHIEGYIIFNGTAANLPSGTTSEKAYFDETNNKLYIYNQSSRAWVSVALT